jgi:hypothetical protein
MISPRASFENNEYQYTFGPKVARGKGKNRRTENVDSKISKTNKTKKINFIYISL